MNIMRRIFNSIVTILGIMAVVVLVSGCGNAQNVESALESKQAEDIIGSWTLYVGDIDVQEFAPNSFTAHFEEDGTGAFTIDGEKTNIKWNFEEQEREDTTTRKKYDILFDDGSSLLASIITETGEEDVKEYEGMLGVGLTESTVLIFEKEED